MYLYKTIAKPAEAEQIIEKSRFICHIAAAKSKDEADAFISQIKSKYKDATHNVPAMVIGDKMQIQWGSDDGEPQGTSGAPIVQMLVKEGISNVVLVVTRYFGGIKLGTGGLVRAYTSSAKLALDLAGVCEVREVRVITARLAYQHLSKIQNLEKTAPFKIDNIEYSDQLKISFSCENDYIEELKKSIDNLSLGSAVFLEEETQLRNFLIDN